MGRRRTWYKRCKNRPQCLPFFSSSTLNNYMNTIEFLSDTCKHEWKVCLSCIKRGKGLPYFCNKGCSSHAFPGNIKYTEQLCDTCSLGGYYMKYGRKGHESVEQLRQMTTGFENLSDEELLKKIPLNNYK